MKYLVSLALCALLLVALTFTGAQASRLSPETESALIEIANDWNIESWIAKVALNGQIGHSKTDSLPGVTVSDEGEITHVNLRAMHLIGPIPSGLAKLTHLVSLDLRDNLITGSIPNFLASLPHLEQLYLSGNYLRGSLPSSADSFKRLLILDVLDTQISPCPVPAWLVDLSQCCIPQSAQQNGCTLPYLACARTCEDAASKSNRWARDVYASPDGNSTAPDVAPGPEPVPAPFTDASIAGIAVGAVIAALVIGLIIFFVVSESNRKKKKRDEEKNTEMPRRFGRENDSTTGTMDSRREVSKQERMPSRERTPESSSSSSSSSSESLVPSSSEEEPAPPPPKPVRKKKKRRAKKAAAAASPSEPQPMESDDEE